MSSCTADHSGKEIPEIRMSGEKFLPPKTQHSDEEIQVFGVGGPLLMKLIIQKGALLCCNAFSFSVKMKLSWKLHGIQ